MSRTLETFEKDYVFISMFEQAPLEDILFLGYGHRNRDPISGTPEIRLDSVHRPPVEVAGLVLAVSQRLGNGDDSLVFIVGKRDKDMNDPNCRRIRHCLPGSGTEEEKKDP
jgi:hypothetical protein